MAITIIFAVKLQKRADATQKNFPNTNNDDNKENEDKKMETFWMR